MTSRPVVHPAAPARHGRRLLLAFLATVGLVLAGLALGAAALGFALVSTSPTLTRTTQLSPQDIKHVRSLWNLAQPLRTPNGQTTELAATARDLDLLAQEAAARLLQGAAAVTLRPAGADFQLSARVPRSALPVQVPVALWLNLSGSVRESAQGVPELTRLQVGSVPVPPRLALWAAQAGAAHLGLAEPLAQGLGLVERVTLNEAGVTARLRADRAFADTLRVALVPPPLRQALEAFNRRLVALVGEASAPAKAPPAGGSTPLELWRLVSPMFQLAAQRSAEGAGIGAAEGNEAARASHAALQNRAALLTLALYVNGQPLSRLVPAAREWPRPAPRLVLGAGREDRPQHLLLAAVLAAEGGGRLADAMGVLKEVSDRSSTGSGFSFDDLAADHAGKRLGQRAVRDPFTLQQRLATVKADADLLPSTDGLPSFLDDATFRSAIGSEGSPRYQALMADIEARVAAVPVLR